MLRVFRRLLRLLPRDFRREFGSEVLATVEERWRDHRGRVGRVGAWLFWLRQCVAVVRASVSLRLFPGRPRVAADVLHDPLRGERTLGLAEEIRLDLKQTLRGFGANPGFTLLGVVTLAVGIGATTAVFSAVYSILYRPLPYAQPDAIVTVVQRDPSTGSNAEGVAAANIRDLARESRTLSEMAVAEPWSLDFVDGERTVSLRSWMVSRGFFEALGVEAAHGRTFLPEEYDEGAGASVILGHGLWTDRFGADPGVVGSAVILDGGPHAVVGVMGSDFKFPDAASAWIPRPPQPWDPESRMSGYMTGVARLTPGATLPAARAELAELARGLAELHPEAASAMDFRLIPLRERLFGDVRSPLLLLFGAVVVVLLIAAANVAGLHLARGYRRQRELALRGALGATSGRLMRMSLLESALLAATGAGLGVGLAVIGVRAIRALAPPELPRIDEIAVDGAVLAWAAAAAAICVVLSGLPPALAVTRERLATALGDIGRGATTGRARARLRRRILVGQFALAVVLLIGAGLLVRSFAVVMENELGFDPQGKLAVQVFAYDGDLDYVRGFARDAVAAIAAVPGVRDVAMTNSVPLATDATLASIDVPVSYAVADRAQPPPGGAPVGWISMISPNYPELMEIDVVRGRAFEPSDDASSRPVVLINETLARQAFPEADPVGRFLTFLRGDGTVSSRREVVGVLRDVRGLGFESDARPEIYAPFEQLPNRSLTFVVRADVDPSSLLLPVQEAIWSVNPTEAVWAAAPMSELLSDLLRERRFNLYLLGGFAVLALFLCAIGIYGLMAHSVEERVRELGIRRALGGRSSAILGMVLAEGAGVAAVGVVLGVLGALATTRLLERMLYGVDPLDPLTFGSLAVAVLAVAALATYLPARRAIRVDPMTVLKTE